MPSTVVADQFEVASSCKDTEYSVNPLNPLKDALLKLKVTDNRKVFQLTANSEEFSEKQLKKLNLEKGRKNITMTLREENDRATQPIRKSNRLDKRARF